MESLGITIKLPLTLEYNQLCIKLSSCDVKAAAITYLRNITHSAEDVWKTWEPVLQ